MGFLVNICWSTQKANVRSNNSFRNIIHYIRNANGKVPGYWFEHIDLNTPEIIIKWSYLY